jgi:crotonobetainyl-CoA hydratase
MAYEYILTERRGHVFVLTLNRPEKRNALNSAMWAEIADAIEAFDADDDARVLVMTNNGPCFCAGSDLKEIAAGTLHAPAGHEMDGFATICGHYCEKPVIVAVEGMCMGGGTEIVMAADLAVASSDATFGLPEVKRGLMASGGGSFLRLGRAFPTKFAMEMVLTGDAVDAQTALSWGMINHVAEPGHALDKALELAERIAANAPIAVRRSKRMLYDCMNQPWLAQDNLAWDACLASDARIQQTEDAQEGARAFAEKREPHWQNR